VMRAAWWAACACAGVGGAEHVRHVVRASSVLLRALGAACGSDAGVVDRVVRSGWIVCLCVSHAVCWWWVFVLVRAVCGCGAEVRGRVVGGAVVLSSAVRALRWFDVSLTYLGVCAGRQVGGVGQ
jgi:hypothetical protein